MRPAGPGQVPGLSVLVSTRNQATMLEETLSHFGRLISPRGGWELIVVNNGSTDGTAEVLSAARADLPLSILEEPEPGKNRALNRAVVHARGELVVFTDDDVVVDPEWLVRLRDASDRWPAHQIFAGPTVARFPAGTPDWLQRHQVCNFARFHFGASGEAELPDERLPFGCNFAVRADVVRAHRFREDMGPAGPRYVMGGESEFLRRITAHGARAVYVPEARVQHLVRPWQLEFMSLYRRAFRLGRGAARLNPPETQVSIAGIPRWSVLGVAGAGIRCLATVFSRSQRKFEARATFCKRLGYLYQCVADSRQQMGVMAGLPPAPGVAGVRQMRRPQPARPEQGAADG